MKITNTPILLVEDDQVDIMTVMTSTWSSSTRRMGLLVIFMLVFLMLALKILEQSALNSCCFIRAG